MRSTVTYYGLNSASDRFLVIARNDVRHCRVHTRLETRIIQRHAPSFRALARNLREASLVNVFLDTTRCHPEPREGSRHPERSNASDGANYVKGLTRFACDSKILRVAQDDNRVIVNMSAALLAAVFFDTFWCHPEPCEGSKHPEQRDGVSYEMLLTHFACDSKILRVAQDDNRVIVNMSAALLAAVFFDTFWCHPEPCEGSKHPEQRDGVSYEMLLTHFARDTQILRVAQDDNRVIVNMNNAGVVARFFDTFWCHPEPCEGSKHPEQRDGVSYEMLLTHFARDTQILRVAQYDNRVIVNMSAALLAAVFFDTFWCHPEPCEGSKHPEQRDGVSYEMLLTRFACDSKILRVAQDDNRVIVNMSAALLAAVFFDTFWCHPEPCEGSKHPEQRDGVSYEMLLTHFARDTQILRVAQDDNRVIVNMNNAGVVARFFDTFWCHPEPCEGSKHPEQRDGVSYEMLLTHFARDTQILRVAQYDNRVIVNMSAALLAAVFFDTFWCHPESCEGSKHPEQRDGVSYEMLLTHFARDTQILRVAQYDNRVIVNMNNAGVVARFFDTFWCHPEPCEGSKHPEQRDGVSYEMLLTRFACDSKILRVAQDDNRVIVNMNNAGVVARFFDTFWCHLELFEESQAAYFSTSTSTSTSP